MMKKMVIAPTCVKGKMWKHKVLLDKDGQRFRRHELGILVVTTLDFFLFDVQGLMMLEEACAALAQVRDTPVTLVIDREYESKDPRGPLQDWFKGETVPDVLAGWDKSGKTDLAEWDGSGMVDKTAQH